MKRAIESSNNHLKNQIRQALAIRGSHDFETKNEYELFVDQLVERRNRRTKPLLVDEQRQLQPLPKYDCVNYTVHVLKVSTTSTIQLKRVTYSVPSRLIGGTVRVHLYDKTLEVYCHDEHTLTLERVHTHSCRRGHQINYKHIIGSLMKKPRAFRGCQWRDQMLPSDDYRQIWQYVDAQLTMDEASFYMVKRLNVANKSEREEAVGRVVLDGIRVGRLPTLFDCEDRFLKDEIWADSPKVEQHTLSSYQQILEGVK
ncbi:hypothetical protein A165_05970 [Vibrio tasmaniensis ZS-17]|nr:hypothetical protein A165_24880 [Vibrio tasmaniensis ZS-17]OED61034.1 hypothetical protein A165_16260 [Vibrio tasmaniensis ZS-17]OED61110.1 hypothetical protein A165_16670 [Vibrio tasmaniensis ZS-17]OED61217.1 hypothetical protein A165_17245 [Vibrio tasmaniensis ZS-17]OED61382.1 hypothetical protein A165_18140 [Vibrio tasmaniensis ZS-17]